MSGGDASAVDTATRSLLAIYRARARSGPGRATAAAAATATTDGRANARAKVGDDDDADDGADVDDDRHVPLIPAVDYTRWRADAWYDVPHWYPVLRDHTFATAFVPLARRDARAFARHYEFAVLKQTSAQPNAADVARLAAVRARLQAVIDSFVARPTQVTDSGAAAATTTDAKQTKTTADASAAAATTRRRGVFVRMSARSPKDAPFAAQRMKHIIAHKLETLHDDADRDAAAAATMATTAADTKQSAAAAGAATDTDVYVQNREFRAFFESQIESLEVFDATTALEFVLHSQRVYDDIQRAFGVWDYERALQAAGTVAGAAEATAAAGLCPVTLQLVVRAWDPALPLWGEFRGFVRNRQLTALSQYFDCLWFRELGAHPKRVHATVRRIRAFFETVKHLPAEADYVMDFGVRSDGGAVCVIELNPFNRFTGAALFDWTRDADVLYGRARPFEFRYVTQPLPYGKRPAVQATNGTTSADPMDALVGLGGGGGANDDGDGDDDVASLRASIHELVSAHHADAVERINADLRFVLRKQQCAAYERYHYAAPKAAAKAKADP